LLEGLSLALARDGALLLGAGETALSNSNRFTSDPALPMVYRTANRTSLTNAA
jgi:chemotaxis protein methyltransferase CheR